MRKRVLIVAYIIGLLWCGTVYAQQNPEEILRAVVKIRAVIPESARTARILGTEREGNGVVIDSKGHVLTIGYLVLEAETIELVGPDDEVREAVFVGYDYHSGLGLVRATPPFSVQPVPLGYSSDVNIEDVLLVVGHGGSEATQGTQVVARQEFAGSWEYLLEDAIFTSPPYSNFGGAALIGRDGTLLGIGSLFNQVRIAGLGRVPSNMFVPIDHLKPILQELIAQGRPSTPSHPWLGLNVEESLGRVFVLRVSSDGPAERDGLNSGDIILAVNSQPVQGLSDFYRKVWALGSAGVEVPLRVLQGVEVRDIKIQSGDRYQVYDLLPKD